VTGINSNGDKASILFVCCGNRERSLIAENMLRQGLKNKHPQLSDMVEIRSAGIFPRSYLEHAGKHGVLFEYPYFDKRPNTYAIDYLAEKGIDVSSYRSRGLDINMVAGAGLILAIDRRIRDEILQIFPMSSGRVFTFKEFAFGPNSSELDIGDSMKLPDIDKETGVWVWPDDYPASFISDIEQCLFIGMDKFVEHIQGMKAQ
jgi:protein arginine phosphatase